MGPWCRPRTTKHISTQNDKYLKIKKKIFPIFVDVVFSLRELTFPRNIHYLSEV
jgi:hypothetical protein